MLKVQVFQKAKKPGAHEEFDPKPDSKMYQAFAEPQDRDQRMTLAPELPGATALIDECATQTSLYRRS